MNKKCIDYQNMNKYIIFVYIIDTMKNGTIPYKTGSSMTDFIF